MSITVPLPRKVDNTRLIIVVSVIWVVVVLISAVLYLYCYVPRIFDLFFRRNKKVHELVPEP